MRSLPFIAAIALLSGCVPTEFEDLRAESPTVSLAPPDDYPISGFGRVAVGYGGTLSGTFASRIALTAGGDSPLTVFPLLIGEELRLDTPVLEACDSEAPCERGAGVSVAGIPVWGDREMCLAITAPEMADISIRCEDNVGSFERITGPGSQRFGYSAAGIVRDHVWGRAIFGAPAAPGGGAVYRLPDRMNPIALDLSEGMGAGAELGTSVAIAIVDADTVLIAASAPIGGTKRVIVATSDIDGGGVVTTRVRDCLDEPSEGWGEALAVGDLNADGIPDVAIGSGGRPGRLDVVRVYDGASMPPEGTCDGSWAPSIEIVCPSAEDVTCGEAAFFGSALAIGDFDADGFGDLLVGAPDADVGETSAAGAVFLFRGANTIADLDQSFAVLVHSSPTVGAHLGASVTSIPGAIADASTQRRRDEPAAGAPGVDRVYVFLCSGLGGDSTDTTNSLRCQPQ
jgi:hypothetical protein